MNIVKKAVPALALCAAMICGGTATAQTKKQENKGNCIPAECTATCPTQQAQCQLPCQKDGKHKEGRHHHGRKGHKEGGKMQRALQGIELTQTQKDAIKEMAKKQRDNDKESKREMKRKSKENFDNGMKQILTPEQYTRYQSNIAQMKKDGKNAGDKERKHRHHSYSQKD